MLSLMDRLSYLVIFLCFTCIHASGGGEDLTSSCEVELLIRRGTSWFAAPGQSVTVSCPVQHCGERLNIIWCKLLDDKTCERVKKSKNVEIRQNHDGDKLVSYLSFKEISVHDDGLYRCETMGFKELTTSHAINISVSDTHEGVKNNMIPDNDPAQSLSADRSKVTPWLPYFAICLSVALLIVALTLIILLRFYGWKRILTLNRTKGEEMSSHTIPDLPKWNVHSSPVLHAHLSVPNDIYLSSAAGAPSPNAKGKQAAVANAPMKGQRSGREVYVSIDHRLSGIPHIQPTAPKQDKGTDYAAIHF